jgi:hypothetical protein
MPDPVSTTPDIRRDSAGDAAEYVPIENVQPGEAICGGWKPWPIVRSVEVKGDEARMIFDHGAGGWQPLGMPVPCAR